MLESLEWLKNIVLFYPGIQYAVIFFGTAFGGEIGPLILAFLTAQNIIPLAPFLLLAFLGALFADIIWFYLGKTRTFGKIMDHRYAVHTVFVITEAVRKLSRGSHLLALIFTKFLIGTRVVLIMYVGRTDIKLNTFIKYDIVATVIWLSVVFSIGYLSSLGFNYLANILENIYAGIGFVLLVILLILMAQVWLKKIFTKEGEEIVHKN